MSAFELLAECSISFAGFAAVYAVLRGSRGLRGAFRAWTTVAHGFLAFFCSLLPILLSTLELSEPAIWRVSSAVACVGVVAGWVTNVVVNRRLNALGQLAQLPWVLRFSLSIPVLTLTVLSSNIAGWPWPPGDFLYLLAIVLTLTMAVIAFTVSFWIPLRGAWAGEVPD
jgi:hypothetical protein